MIPSTVLSIALLAAAGAMIDAHLRDWRRAATTLGSGRGTPATADAARFALARRTRRLTASGAIAVVGALIGVWPLVPQRPWWVASFAALLATLACLIFLLGVADALANGRYYRAERRRLLDAERSAMNEMLAEKRVAADQANETSAEQVTRT
ncbi:MAG: hypothetical protein AAFV43_04880 [Planctomycetota bacterium]